MSNSYALIASKIFDISLDEASDKPDNADSASNSDSANKPDNNSADATSEASTDREKVLQARETDNAHVKIGDSGDLFSYDQIGKPSRTWDGSVPIVYSKYCGEMERHESLAAAVSMAKTALAPLDGFKLLGWTGMSRTGMIGKGMIVAGGAAAAWMTKQNYGYGDVDFFLVGLSEKDAVIEIDCFARTLYQYTQKNNKTLTVFRSQRCISFKIKDENTCSSTIYQVILRRYNTISEVLHGFDLGSSSIAFTGGDFLVTSLGKMAFERMVNVVNLSRRRSSYEYRLCKYFSRGFGIAFPEVDELKSGDQLKFAVYSRANDTLSGDPGYSRAKKIQKNVFYVYNLIRYGSDYSSQSEYGHIQYNDLGLLDLNNLRQTLEDPVNVEGLCAYETFGPLHMAAGVTGASVTKINPSYTNLFTGLNRLVDPKKLNVEKLFEALGPELGAVILRELAKGGGLNFRKMSQLSTDLGNAAKERSRIPFQFAPLTDGTAMEGPFKGSIMTDKEWYSALTTDKEWYSALESDTA